MENSKVQALKVTVETIYLNCQISYAAGRIYLYRFTLHMPQVLGESMAGISQHCKTGDVLAFGESVAVASKALCGLTEAGGQVRTPHSKLTGFWFYSCGHPLVDCLWRWLACPCQQGKSRKTIKNLSCDDQ